MGPELLLEAGKDVAFDIDDHVLPLDLKLGVLLAEHGESPKDVERAFYALVWSGVHGSQGSLGAAASAKNSL